MRLAWMVLCAVALAYPAASAPAEQLDTETTQLLQAALRDANFDPGPLDGQYGPRTRAAVRAWQEERGEPNTGYLTKAQLDALTGSGPAPGAATNTSASGDELEIVFWESIRDSTDAADFEAYLNRFSAGSFNVLAERRRDALTKPANETAASQRTLVVFGDDKSLYAHDGECDDPRFEGPGMATTLLDEDRLHDATDCRQQYQAGRIQLAPLEDQPPD